MSYLRARKTGLGATVYGPEAAPVANILGGGGSFLDVPQATTLSQTALQAATQCPAGYAKDIAGNCAKAQSSSSTWGNVANFFTDWFKQDQLNRGRAQGAAEGAALLAAQQQSGVTDYLPYILIGGGLLTAVLLLRR